MTHSYLLYINLLVIFMQIACPIEKFVAICRQFCQICDMIDINSIDFAKQGGLIPAVVQHYQSGAVLMVGFMNHESLAQTIHSKTCIFWSRTKGRLWQKGETSGHFLHVEHISLDCDKDTILIQARPAGPTCHTGAETCFYEEPYTGPLVILHQIGEIIQQRAHNGTEKSYTKQLLESGIKRIAQKVGEEGLETALAAVAGDNDELLNESADLLYHTLVLLHAKGLNLSDVAEILHKRMKK